MAPKRKVHYFRAPPFYYFPSIIGGMSLVTVLAASPELLPYDSLWYFGRFLHYMAYDQSTLTLILSCAAWIAHVFEASYAYSLCRKLYLTKQDTLKWTLQTFILGFPSLGLLTANNRNLDTRNNIHFVNCW